MLVEPAKYKISDGNSLYLVVYPSGKKTWKFRYRYGDKPREHSIGNYPDVSLAEARETRVENQKLLRDNVDPCSHYRQKKQVAVFQDRNTFQAVAEEWFELNKAKWTQKYAYNTWTRLNTYVFPYIGARPVASIEPLEFLDVIRKIERKGMTDLSSRIFQVSGAIFRYAIITGRLLNNPAANLVDVLLPHRKTHHPTICSDEINILFKAFREVRAPASHKTAFLFLLKTAVRTGEMRHGEWHEIDFEKKLWIIDSEKMKMSRDHIVPLSDQSVTLLRLIRRLNLNDRWIFPNQTGGKKPVLQENAINDLLRKMGFGNRLVGHGFRSLFSTVMNEESTFNSDAIERQLAHVDRNKIRSAYNRAQYLDERTEMMQWWSDYLEKKAECDFSELMTQAIV